jgi:hypothetical protein
MTTNDITPEGVDIALLDAAIEQIKLHPETWEQGAWRCETGMCVAGWVVTLAGDSFAYPADSPDAALVLVPKGTSEAVVWVDPEHHESIREGYELAFCETRANELLGFPLYGSPAIFEPRNTLEDIERYRDEIAAGYVRDECEVGL